jgi:AcrR family transcriptional regulator
VVPSASDDRDLGAPVPGGSAGDAGAVGGADEVAADAGRRRTRLDPERRREQIIDAAEAVFSLQDPNDVTFEQVADAAGVSRALVYNYFGDKGGLIAAVYARWFRRLDVQLARGFSSNRPGPDQLRAVVRTYLDFAAENAGICKLISMAEVNSHPLVQQARHQRYERLASGWAPSPEARLVARGIVAMLEGVVLDWLDTQDCSRERTEALLFALLWSGAGRLQEHGIDMPVANDLTPLTVDAAD